MWMAIQFIDCFWAHLQLIRFLYIQNVGSHVHGFHTKVSKHRLVVCVHLEHIVCFFQSRHLMVCRIVAAYVR